MGSLRLIIVDDEPLVRDGIRNSLKSLEDIQIVAECASGEEAVEAIRSLKPDIILLDIKLHDCSGIDVIERVGPSQMPTVIFITAFDEYAIRAFELNAVDYILKPFDANRLFESVKRAHVRLAGEIRFAVANQLQALIELRARRWTERIAVRRGDSYELIPVESIDWIESANNFVAMYCGTKNYLVRETLASFAQRLNPRRFLRIHRCRIVNISRVLTIHPMLNGTYEFELHNGKRLGTGRQYKETIRSLLA